MPGKPQNVISDEQIDKIVQTYENRVDVEKFAHVATMDEIIENGYNLNIPRYVDTSEDVPDVDLDTVAGEIGKIDDEIKAVSNELKKSFDLLGLAFPF